VVERFLVCFCVVKAGVVAMVGLFAGVYAIGSLWNGLFSLFVFDGPFYSFMVGLAWMLGGVPRFLAGFLAVWVG